MPTGETVSPHCGGCAPLLTLFRAIQDKLLESCWKRMAPLGLRDGWDYDAHHVMALPRFRLSERQAEAVFHSSPAIRWSEMRSSDWLMALVSKDQLLSSIAKVGSLVIRCPLKRDQLDMPSMFRHSTNAIRQRCRFSIVFPSQRISSHLSRQNPVQSPSSRLSLEKQFLPRFSFRPVAVVAWIPSAQ